VTGGKPKLKKFYREVIGAAEDEAHKCGARLVGFDLTGKHPSVTISRYGEERTRAFPSSPRVAESAVNMMRQQIRRLAREMADSGGSAHD
jgi:hypothetical protein